MARGRRILSLWNGSTIAPPYGRGMMQWEDPLQQTEPVRHGSGWMIDGSTSEDGQHAAILSRTGAVWSIEAGDTAPHQVTRAIDASSIDISVGSRDGLLAVATHNGDVGVWDLETGALRGRLSGHNRRAVTVDFGEAVPLTASWDHSAQLWALDPLLDPLD